MHFQADDTGGVSTEGSGTAPEAPSHEGTLMSLKVGVWRALLRGGETFKCAFPESPASSDLEDCATTASRVEGVNLEDYTKPLKQTSAGAVWSGRGSTRSRSGLGHG